MKLGEKLFKLRKEKGLSQEALADAIGTTRQAVSKWENNQGFPETEKLMMLATFFEVSVDYLLKEEKSERTNEDKGYYVSQEMARGYLQHEWMLSRYIATGFMFWALAGIPYMVIPEGESSRFLGVAVFILLGIASFVLGMFREQEKYKVLTQEPLLFDQEVHKELVKEYHGKKKKYQMIAVPCSILLMGGLLVFLFTKRGYIEVSELHSFVFLGIAAGIFGFIQAVAMLEAYELLVMNEQHCNHFFFKLKKKLMQRFDKL